MFKWIALTLPCLALVLTPGCGSPPPASTSTQQVSDFDYDPKNDPLINPPELFEAFPTDNPELADTDATLTRLLIGEPRNINPIFANSWMDFYFLELCFTALFVRNENLESIPNMDRIAKLTESKDRKLTRIEMVRGQTWHDGQPFTANDVRFSWEAITDDKVPAAFYKHTASQIEDVKVIDDYTLEIVHREATPTNWMNMGFPIIPKHIYGNPVEREKDPTLSHSEYYNHYNREELVGCGPYRLVEWTTNDRLVVERWEDYPMRKPYFKRQILKIHPDRNIALLLFKKGELDEIWLTPQQFATQCDDEAFKAVGVKGYGTRRMFAYVGWNMDGSNPFFADRKVRVAMAKAFDRDRVLREVSYNLFTPSNGIFDSEHWAHNPDIVRHEYDLEEAGRLLDEAGWLVSDDDGWRYKEIDGTPVKFDFEVIIALSFPHGSHMLEIYREDLKKIGVSFRTRVLENATFDSTYLKHEFQALASVWEVSSDPDLWRNHFHSEQHMNGRNICGFKNDRVDELFDLTRSTFDKEERAKYFREIQAIIYDEQPHMFAWNYTNLQGFSKRLRGVNFSPAGVYLFRPSQYDWWMAKEAI